MNQVITKDYDVLIIGAGAAGLMCAIEVGKRGKKILLVDKASKVGKKILIAGGGRCNYTNLYIDPSAYLSDNPHFCKSALSRYTQWDFMALMDKHGLTGHEKTLGQLFCDQKSPAIVKMLIDECQNNGVDIHLNTTIQSIKETRSSITQSAFIIQTNKAMYAVNALVIATGGASIPRMGSTDFALQVAKQFNIQTLPFRAGLVPLVFSGPLLQSLFQTLAGISFYAQVTCNQQSFTESVLITHRGLSGPAILQLSSYWTKGKTIAINLLPKDNTLEWLTKEQTKHPESQLITVLNKKLPKRLAHYLTQQLTNNTKIKMKQLSVKQRNTLIEQLTHWQLSPSGTEGMRTAEVCLGGVHTNALSSKTFESKQIKNLYFIGEAIDVTGHLGGYNFQWAWASGWSAGQYV